MTVGRVFTALIDTRALRALQHRNYRLYFLGQLVSVSGTRMHVIAQGWLVLTLSGDPFMLGVVTAAQYGPLLLLGLFGGLIADGVRKRSTLIVTQALALVLAIVLFAVSTAGVVQVWHVVGIAAVLGLVEAIDTPTRQSFTIEMVGRDDVANAVALNMTAFNIARVIGPAIAGLVIAGAGTSAVFLINAVSYAAVITGLLAMRGNELRDAPRRRRPNTVGAVLADVREGLDHVWRSPHSQVAVVTLGLVSVFGINFQVLGPALARDVLRSDATGYGFLMTAFGLGALASAFGVAALGTSTRVLTFGALILGLSNVALAVSAELGVSMALMVGAGIGAIAVGATGNLTLQLGSPDELRGRVMSIYAIVFDGLAPVGALLMGAVASSAGVPLALWIGGLVSVLAGLAAAMRSRPWQSPRVVAR